MGHFEYEALTPAGRAMTGTLEAESREQAEAALRDMQLSVRSLTQTRPPAPRGRIGRSELLLFNEQLAAVARAGIPLERALRELSADAGSERMRTALQAVADDLEAGASVEEAFSRRAGDVPALYGRVIAAGVRTGRLAEMLASLNRHLDIAAQTRRILVEALAYPVTILVLATAILGAMLTFVVPQFRDMFDVPTKVLPWSTQATFWLSDHVEVLGLCAAGVAAAVVLAAVVLSASPAGRRVKEAFALSFPGVGRVYRATLLGRFADALAVLVGAGCDLPAALRLAGGTTGRQVLRDDAEEMARRIEQGDDLSAAGDGCRMLPRFFLYSMTVGAARNELADGLYGLADMYADQARSLQGRLQAMLTPVLIVVLGAVIGLGIYSMFQWLPKSLEMIQG